MAGIILLGNDMFFRGEFKPSRKNKALVAGEGCRKTFGIAPIETK